LISADLPHPTAEPIVDHLGKIALQAGEEFLFVDPNFAAMSSWRIASRDTGQMIPASTVGSAVRHSCSTMAYTLALR
jgi:hypothetical protein